jgi:predicted methyltransferase
MKIVLLGLLLAVCSLGGGASFAADSEAALASRITLQLSAPGRGEFDALKDPGRKPLEMMRFFGVEAGMTVLDVAAGGGYNTEILSAAVGVEGTVYAQNSHYILRLINGAHHNAMLERVADRRLPNVRYMMVDTADMPFSNDIDVAVWGFNLHDIYNSSGAAVALKVLVTIKQTLKPGGVLGLSDHIGVAGNDNADLHRIEPSVMTALLLEAGFTVDATSDLLANPADDHTQSVYAEGLRYATDRILIRARKPQ